jgi:hypothetical protein
VIIRRKTRRGGGFLVVRAAGVSVDHHCELVEEKVFQ